MVSTADRIKDIGPQPQSFDIERATKENTNYRSVAWSGRYLQVTLMSIPVRGDIGLEAHPETDQFLRLDAGSGRVQMGPAKDKLTFEKEVSNGWCVLVPQGPGTTSPISARRQCRSMRSTRPPIILPTRCRRRRRRLKPTKTTSQRRGQCSQNMPPINTGDRKELGKLLQSLTAGDQVLATDSDKFSGPIMSKRLATSRTRQFRLKQIKPIRTPMLQIKEGTRMPARNNERHRTGRIGWLRAAVLGANDGILSTSSLVLGVAAAHATHSNILVAGVAGLGSWGYVDGRRRGMSRPLTS